MIEGLARHGAGPGAPSKSRGHCGRLDGIEWNKSSASGRGSVKQHWFDLRAGSTFGGAA
jgi:hypothetical protein